MVSSIKSSKITIAFFLVITMICAPLSGCLDPNNEKLTADDLLINLNSNEEGQSGFFQNIEFQAKSAMSIYIPYLIEDEITGYVQNSTVIDLSKRDVVELSILVPPRAVSMIFFIGEENREYWPIRSQDESWSSWLIRGGAEEGVGNGIQRVSAENNNSYDSVNNSVTTGGPVISKSISIFIFSLETIGLLIVTALLVSLLINAIKS